MSTVFRALIRLALVVSFCFLYATHGLAQSQQPTAPIVKFGKVTAADFAPSPTLTDSTAEAEVLYDFGEVRFEATTTDIWMEFVCHRRVRILKKSATSRGTVEVPTFKGNSSEREYLSSVDGFTYNLNGDAVSTDKLTKEGRATEKVSDKVMIEKFTMPNVREGSIIEYKYVIRTPFSTAHNPRTWTFQETIPVRWSEYKITIPSYYYYKIIMGGYLGLAVQEQKSTTVQLFRGESDAPATAYRFAVVNAPAFRTEKYITTKSDYLSKIDFELASVTIPGGSIRNYSEGWEAMDNTLLEADWFGGQIKRAPFLRDVATLIRTQNPTDSLARLSAAYDFVRKSIKWDETSSYTTNSIKKVFEAKKGDAGDINLLLIALLRELNFEVYPVILSTRSHGRVLEEYALMRQFNYVVAQVSTNGQTILLDATDPIIKPGMLPTRCLNQSGRLIAPDNQSRFVSLVPAERDSEMLSGMFTLTDDGEAKGTLKHSRGGYSGWAARTQYQQDGEAKYIEAVRKKRPNWQVTKSEITGADKPNDSFEITHTLLIPDAYSEAADRIYLWPMLTEARTENPFKEAERLYPVDFGTAIDELYMTTFTLPEGYTVEELPKPAALALPDKGGRFTYQVTQAGNTIQVMSRLTLRKTVYLADEYGALRELFALVVAKHAERVVLKRGEVAKK
jgi:hypothetical protein